MPEGDDPVHELRDFVTFLGSLWGVLAGVSVAFPLSNALTEVIPLGRVADDPTGAFAEISPNVVSVVSTISVLFAVFFLFGRRVELSDPGQRLRNRRQALTSFAAGIVLLAAYVGLYEVKIDKAYEDWGWQSDDSANLLVEIPLMLLYAGFFTCLTAAFVLLALNEYAVKTSRQSVNSSAPS